MRKLLLTLLLFLGSLGAFAQSDVVVFSNNPNMTYVAGETMTFSVMITNNGPQAALNVAVYFPIPTGIPIPAGVTKFWWTGSNGSAGTNVQLNNTIPVLNVNQTVTYTINIKIPNEYTLPIDPVQVTYATRSDIEVIKTDNQATYEPNTDVVYTITVINHGPEATTKSVQVTDAIPAGITQFSWTGNGNNGTNVPLVAQTGILDVGEEVTYTVTLHVPATFTGNLVNTVSYIATVTDPTPTCPQCTDTDVPNTGANLVVTTTNNQTTYTAGGTAVYTVTVTNNGPQDAAGVNVSVPVPTGVTITSWTGSNSSSGTGAVADAVGTLADGESVTYTITIAIPATKTGALSVNATATSTTADPDTSCTLCTDTDFDASSADIVTTKTLGSGTAYTAGTNAIYTITVHNNGPTAAQNVIVSDVVPAGLSAANANWTGSNGTFGTGNLLDTIALMENGTTVTYTFTIPIPSNFSQTTNIVNEVTVTSDTPDPVPGCTTCTVTATPNPMANLVTLKTNGQSSYLVNSSTVYTITVTNPGPSDAYNVVVKDNKPYNIDVMTWEGNGTGGSGSFTNTIPVLAAGESMIYTVQMFIPEDYATFVGNLTNTAIITSSTPDPIPACPTCIDTDTPRGNFVTTSNDQYTVPELIEDVLIDVNCVGIDNVTWSTGTNYGSWNNGIAYFHANNSTFPIYEGVVLTSGNAVPTPGQNDGVDGPNLTTISSTSWAGDDDLEAATGTNTFSASWIKFNFVPVSDSFSFNYLFASEEYGNSGFECSFTDVFAFLLVNETSGVTTPLNLAVIPGTTTPVGVTTIHPDNGAWCGGINEEYFGQYNIGTAAATAPINFNGQTVIMQASATVVPNDTYSIKLAIANGNDPALNSAVFIEAGSFDIGQPQLPPDITLGNEALLLCHGDTFVLDAAVANEDMLVKWKMDGEWLLDEDGEYIDTETITVSEPGTYTVLGYFASNPDCFISDDIIIDFYPEIMAGEPIDLEACGTTANGVTTGVFNLTENTPILLNGMPASGYTVTYYANAVDAAEGFPVIPAAVAAAYSAENGHVISVTIEDYNTQCLLTKTFVLNTLDCNVPLTPIETLHICEAAPYNQFEIFDLTSQNDVLLNQIDPADFTITYHNSQADANTGDNPIGTPENYNGTTETIYIRVERNDNPTAFGTTSFDLIVTPQPVIVEVEDVEACNSYVLPEIEAGSYYTAANGQGQLLQDGSLITETQTVYIFAQEGEAPYTCTDETSFVVTIYNTPVIAQPQDVVACEGYILPVLTIGNYFTGANGTGIQLFAESVIEETQVIHIFATSGDEDFSCPADVFFTVTINTPPAVADALPLEACDYTLGDANTVNDFSAAFNLTQAGAQVIGNQTGLTVTYYTDQAGALSGSNVGLIPAAQAVSYYTESTPVTPAQPLYIRVVSSTDATNCATVVPLQLIVHPTPVIPVIADFVKCDYVNSPDGTELFDLTTKDIEADVNPELNNTVTYYTTQADAVAGVNAIQTPTAYPSETAANGEQTVYVRVESTFGCFRTSSFTLVVNPLPVIITPTEPFLACEETPGQALFDLDAIGPVVTGGAAGFTASYYATEALAIEGGTGLATPYSSPNATIYVRVINDLTGCASITTANLQVLPAPIAPAVPALEECDANNDQVATFNINTALDYILSYMGGSVTLTVHETLNDATYEANALSAAQIAAYTNVFAFTTDGVQTLYIRVEGAGTECFDIAELQLIVHPTPVAVTPAEPYALCDNGASDTDGEAVFDLTTYAEEVLGLNNPALYTVSYHATQNGAAIPNPASYSSQSGPVYIQVTNNATGCYDIVELELIVNPLPVVNNPTPLTVCDDNDPDNETEEFDLTIKIDEIIGVGTLGLNVTFHTSYADAQGNTNAIANPDAYTNTAAVETLFVRVTNAITGCYRIVLLDVRVEPLPEVLDPTEEDLTVCDTNGMGVGTFNLLELVDGLINGGGANLSIHFYETAIDAANGLNEIPNPASYQNPTPFLQPIYVVVENATTGCQSNAYEFFLIVAPAPQAPALENIIDCDDYDNNDQDGKARVDLTVQNQVIYDALNIAAGDQDSIIIHYFTSEEDANADINMITNATQYTATNEQVIWVRVEDAETGCYSLTSFQVILNKPVDLIQPTPLVLCEDGTTNDGKTIFDLTVKNTEILGPMGIGMGNVVTYYTTQADALAGTNPIPTPEAYTNTSNAQTLFVEVTTPAGCKSYITLTIRVLPLPVPNMNPTALEKCDDISADGTETFNLTDAAAQILANDTLSQLSYWPTEEDANNGTNEILTPTAWPSATGSVWVKVSAHTTNATDPVCYVLVELNLIVNPLPATGTIAPYAICQLVYTGTATFDFNTHIDEILGAGVAPEDYDDYTLTFYFDAAAQAAGTPLPYIYDNVSTPQTILVEVVNTVTGCTNTASFVIAVEQQAIANPVSQATLDTYFDICDTDGSNDGYTEFDLTQATADIIGTQSPAANYTVTYYETQADALAGTNAIPTPAAYTNTTQNEQTIVAAISDITTVSGCISYTTFSVKAEILAEPVISTPGDDHTICVDFKTGLTVKGLTLNSGITTAGNTYKWFLDGVEVTIDPSASTYEAVEAGNYTVEVTGPAPNFCVSGVSAAFNVIQSGQAVKIGEGYVVSNAFNENQTITVLVEGYGEYQYSLYPEGPWQNSNVFTNVPMGEQTIHVRDVKTGNSCDELIIDSVSIIDYPHFFTPNGDGYHDTWNIVGLKNYPESRIFIFDRYGKLLKQLSPESDVTEGDGWDGTYNGQPVPSDDYWFTVTYPDGNVTKEFKAHFSLKR